jgi:transposase
VRRDPRIFGHDRSRWSLELILKECPFILTRCRSTLSHTLSRLGISYKRGREYVHSPDPLYMEKLGWRDNVIARVLSAADNGDRSEVVLFLDELTYYRQPTVARAWTERGTGRDCQELARRSHRGNTPTRVAGVLDLIDARVTSWQGSRFNVSQVAQFHAQIGEAYPEAKRIWVVLDNWPVHFHPDARVGLEPQAWPWPFFLPSDWPREPSAKARAKWGGRNLPIQLMPLPTYASWLNPIEKLWRYLKQEVLHLHRMANDLAALRALVQDFLRDLAHGSPDLLRYVGLAKRAPPGAIRNGPCGACSTLQVVG